jgi:MFS family permease
MNASALLSTMNGLSLVGTLVLAGLLGDRIGSKSVIRICFVLLVISLLLLAFAGELWTLYLAAAMPYGIAIGALGTSESPLVAQLFGLGSHGMIFGIGSFGFTTRAAVGPLLTGYLFDVTGTYQPGFIIFAAVAVLGFVLVSMLRPVKKD